MKKKKLIDKLSTWDWKTFVAAWRYYEHSTTISGSSFPADIVERFWGRDNPYTDEVRHRIARQFAHIDHGLRGEKDWKPSKCSPDCYIIPWVTFYQFCRGYIDGYSVLHCEYDGKKEVVTAFHVDYNDRWIPVDRYIENAVAFPYVWEKCIKHIKG